MPRKCRICSHPQREAIDSALARGETLRDISRQHHNRIGKDAIRRHSLKCIPNTLAAAKHEAEVVRGRDLAGLLSDAYSILQRLSDKAERAGEYGTAGRLQAEVLKIGELLLRAQEALARERERPGRALREDEQALYRRVQNKALEDLRDALPDDLRLQMLAWVEARRESLLQQQVAEGEARMLSRLPDDEAERYRAEREAAKLDSIMMERGGESQPYALGTCTPCGRTLRFANGHPLREDLCPACRSAIP